MDHLKDLYDMCETLSRELGEANKKVMQGGGKLSGSDLDYVDKLTHAIKSIKTTIAMMEAEEDGYSGNYSGRMYPVYGRSYADSDMRSYADGRSYAGRRNARRDSMGRYSGRYSRDGYSMHGDEMVSALRDLMQDAPDPQTKQEFERFINKIEQM